MTRTKKVLAILLVALYLFSSVGDIAVSALPFDGSAEKKTVTVRGDEPTKDYTVTDIEHGQKAQDGNNTLIVTLSDDQMEWRNNTQTGTVDPVKIARTTDTNNATMPMTFQYRIQINLDEREDRNYQADGVCITVPLSIIKSSVGSSYTTNRKLETGNTLFELDKYINAENGFRYEKDETAKVLRIYNTGTLTSRTLELTITYRCNRKSYNYADYNPSDLENCASDPFDVDLTLTSDAVSRNLQASGPAFYIDTQVKITSVKKSQYNDWTAIEEKEDGTKVQYRYLLYMFEAYFACDYYSTPTQHFRLNFDDSQFTGYGKTSQNQNPAYQWELVGYCGAGFQDPSRFTLDYWDNTNTTWGGNYTSAFALFRIEQPDSLYHDYKLDNKVVATCIPAWKADPNTTANDSMKWSEYWHNTSPIGMYMVHNWSNSNWESSAHARTHVNGKRDNYNRYHWNDSNCELYYFETNSQNMYGRTVDTLDGLRFYSWYEGYPSKYVDDRVTATYVCESKDIALDWQSPKSGTSIAGTKLTKDDYYMTELGFYVEAQYANRQDGLWIVDKTVDPFAEDHQPIYVYGLIGGLEESNWTLIATVNYNLETKQWDQITIADGQTDNVASYAYTEYEGEMGKKKDTGVFIEFAKKNILGYRIVNTNTHHYFILCARANYSLKRTQRVLNCINNTGTGKPYMYTNSYVDMAVYTEKDEEAHDEETHDEDEPKRGGTRFTGDPDFVFSNATGHEINRAAGAVSVGQNNLLRTEKEVASTEEQTALNRYKVTWALRGWHFMYGGISDVGDYYPVKWIPMAKGVFYDILPRGTVLDPDSKVRVYRNAFTMASSSNDTYFYDTYMKDGAANRAAFDEKFLIPEDQYTVETVTGSWNGTDLDGRTMVIVRINEQSDPYTGPLPGGSDAVDLSGGYLVLIDTITPYSSLAENGNRLVNAVAFEALSGLTYHEGAYKDDPTKPYRTATNDDGTLKDPDLLESIGKTFADYNTIHAGLTDVLPGSNPSRFCYGWDNVFATFNTLAQAGPSKLVAGEDGELQTEIEVEPGGTYTYYLRYATTDKSSAKNLVFVDKVERYDTGSRGPSQWHGTLKGLSAELNDGTVIPATFYVSSDEDADQHPLTDSVWTPVTSETELAGAIWVAADLGDFELEPLGVVFVKLVMEAPTSNETIYVKPETYNNYHIHGLLQESPGSEYTEIDNVTNFTIVKYTLKGKVQIEKVDDFGNPMSGVSFSLTGASKFGGAVDMTETTDADGKAVFEGLDITGDEGYTLTETVPSGYIADKTSWEVAIETDGSSTVDGEDATTAYFRIVNRETTRISVKKIWDDMEDVEELRPDSVEFTLYGNGSEIGTITLDGTADENGEEKPWLAVWEDLPKYEDGEEIEYTVVETSSDVNYEVIYEDGASYAVDGGSITNKHIPSPVRVAVNKKWDDNDDQYGMRPEQIVFTLYKIVDGKETPVGAIALDGTADADGEEKPWIAVWDDLPKFEDGEEIEYVVRETMGDTAYEVIYPDGRNYAVDGGTITNRLLTSVAVNKKWDDGDDRYGLRPESIVFTLYAVQDGKEIELGSVTLDGTGDEQYDENGELKLALEEKPWLAVFKQLPRFIDGVECEYIVKETEGHVAYEVIYPDGQDYAVDGGTITNRLLTSVAVNKKWDDGDDRYGLRPDSITFTLYAVVNGEEIELGSVALDGTGDDQYDENGELKLALEEKPWLAVFKQLPAFMDGAECEYIVKETEGDAAYEVIYPDGREYAVDGGIITNRLLTSVAVNKKWDDNDDQDGKRPENVTFTLYVIQDGEEIELGSVTLDGTGDDQYDENGELKLALEEKPWLAVFKQLPAFHDGIEYEYIVKETSSDVNYEVIYENGETCAYDGGTITNKHVPELTEVKVTKLWDDDDDRDGIRPDAVQFVLWAGNQRLGYVMLDGEVDEDGEFEPWVATFIELDKYKDGEEIEYTVTEANVKEGYVVIYEDGRTYAVDGGTITNHHEFEKTEVKVYKTWDDDDDRDRVRPDSVTFTLYGNGNEIGSITLDGTVDELGELEEWIATWKELAKNDGGEEIDYTVEESSSDIHYEVVYGNGEYARNGEAITNVHVTEKTEVSVLKVWDDKDDQDGKRPESVTFTLYGDGKEIGSITLDGAIDEDGEFEEWKATWKDLVKYEDGVEIEYTVKETSSDENYVVIYEDGGTYAVNGGTITNRHVPETIELDGEKRWDDNDDQDGIRPESIKVNLYADGEKIQTVTVSEEDNWKFKFTNLPKYKEGKEIKYTITEETVDGYETEITDFIIINIHVPEKTEVIVIKEWMDDDDKAEKRPISITVRLYADGVEIGSAVLTEAMGWTHTWDELDKFAEGKEIQYTISEDPVPEYQTEYDGYVITNVYTPNTGDGGHIAGYALSMALSLLGYALLTIFRKKEYC